MILNINNHLRSKSVNTLLLLFCLSNLQDISAEETECNPPCAQDQGICVASRCWCSVGFIGAQCQYERKRATICEGTVGALVCPAGQTINVIEGNFGRTKADVCIDHLLPTQEPMEQLDINCWSRQSTTSKLIDDCQDTTYCGVWSSTNKFKDACPGTPKYLQATYWCKPIDHWSAWENWSSCSETCYHSHTDEFHRIPGVKNRKRQCLSFDSKQCEGSDTHTSNCLATNACPPSSQPEQSSIVQLHNDLPPIVVINSSIKPSSSSPLDKTTPQHAADITIATQQTIQQDNAASEVPHNPPATTASAADSFDASSSPLYSPPAPTQLHDTTSLPSEQIKVDQALRDFSNQEGVVIMTTAVQHETSQPHKSPENTPAPDAKQASGNIGAAADNLEAARALNQHDDTVEKVSNTVIAENDMEFTIILIASCALVIVILLVVIIIVLYCKLKAILSDRHYKIHPMESESPVGDKTKGESKPTIKICRNESRNLRREASISEEE